MPDRRPFIALATALAFTAAAAPAHAQNDFPPITKDPPVPLKTATPAPTPKPTATPTPKPTATPEPTATPRKQHPKSTGELAQTGADPGLLLILGAACVGFGVALRPSREY